MGRDNFIDVASVGLVSGDRLLLIKRGREPSKGLYAFPGGRMEGDETAEDAARRELIEETGLVAGELRQLATLELGGTKGDRFAVGYRLHVFAGPHNGGEPEASDDALEAGWFTLTQIEALPMTPSSLALARKLLGMG